MARVLVFGHVSIIVMYNVKCNYTLIELWCSYISAASPKMPRRRHIIIVRITRDERDTLTGNRCASLSTYSFDTLSQC